MYELLPSLDKLLDKPFNMTEAEAYAFACCTYLLVLVYLVFLFMLLYNIWYILIKRNKYVRTQLTTFYFMCACLAIVRILLCLIWLALPEEVYNAIKIQPAMIKLNLGLTQIWVLIELVLKMNLTIKHFKLQQKRDNMYMYQIRQSKFQRKVQVTDENIRLLNIGIIILISINTFGWMVLTAYQLTAIQEGQDRSDQVQTAETTMYAVIFFMLVF